MAKKPSESVTQNEAEADITESVIHSIPVVLPLVGAALIFLLAFIAVVMT